jgi:hypothetical protein
VLSGIPAARATSRTVSPARSRNAVNARANPGLVETCAIAAWPDRAHSSAMILSIHQVNTPAQCIPGRSENNADRHVQ